LNNYEVSKIVNHLNFTVSFFSGQNLYSQENSDVKIIIKSQEDLSPYLTDAGPVNLKINFRIKNESQKDIYIFGSQYENDFDPLFHLLRFDDSQGKWTFSPFNLETLANNEKVPYRVKKRGYFDFYSTTGRGRTKLKFKAAVYYGYSKKDKPILIGSEEFFVAKIR
jgi:hypothetical protein